MKHVLFLLIVLAANVADAQTIIKVWIEEGGAFAQHTHDESVAALTTGFREIEMFADVKFVRVTRNAGPQLRYEFVPGPEIDNSLGRRSGNWLRFNQDRSIGKPGTTRWPITVGIHETNHTIGIGHQGERMCIQHAWLGKWWCVEEARRWQLRHGPPKKRFYAPEQRMLGAEVRLLVDRLALQKATVERLIAERDASKDVPFRKATQVKVLDSRKKVSATHSQLAAANKEWIRVHNKWKNSGLPMSK